MERLDRGKERILFVDDERSAGQAGTGGAEHLGYKSWRWGRTASKRWRNSGNHRNFDLLITNQTMPHMTGAQLARNVLTSA